MQTDTQCARIRFVQLRCKDRLLGWPDAMSRRERYRRGQAIISRYYPITSYADCSNSQPWAFCLDSPCLIDQKNPSAANCICTETVNQGDYVIVNASGKYSPTSCDSGLYSSATVSDVNEITQFLQTHDTPLKALPITVYKGE
jgi:hypothetical protein